MTPWTTAFQASLSSTISWSFLRFMSIESVMLSNHPSSATPFSFCLQSFPASGSFPVSQLFVSGGQRIGALTSASATLVTSFLSQGNFSFERKHKGRTVNPYLVLRQDLSVHSEKVTQKVGLLRRASSNGRYTSIPVWFNTGIPGEPVLSTHFQRISEARNTGLGGQKLLVQICKWGKSSQL